jgi:23S rRNA (pseudouridine1915-N3)-methyltransferase
LQYRLLYIGRRSADPICAAADAYAKRLSRYVQFDAVAVREQPTPQAESAKLLAGMGRHPACLWVALDEHGTQQTTRQLAGRLAKWQAEGRRELGFVIGGADGHAPELLRAVPQRWALSQLTLPHRLARLVLLEQLYRAHTLLRSEPYHRDGV